MNPFVETWFGLSESFQKILERMDSMEKNINDENGFSIINPEVSP